MCFGGKHTNEVTNNNHKNKAFKSLKLALEPLRIRAINSTLYFDALFRVMFVHYLQPPIISMKPTTSMNPTTPTRDNSGGKQKAPRLTWTYYCMAAFHIVAVHTQQQCWQEA